jgi:hypothetical protein
VQKKVEALIITQQNTPNLIVVAKNTLADRTSDKVGITEAENVYPLGYAQREMCPNEKSIHRKQDTTQTVSPHKAISNG